MSPTSVVAYLVLFAAAGFFLVFVALLLGRLLRPRAPTPEKLETYECGERTIGTSYVQFDLRFYVVALVFLIFDVEVAFFFPWATVFGKAVRLSSPAAATGSHSAPDAAAAESWSRSAAERMRQLGVPSPHPSTAAAEPAASAATFAELARKLARAAMADMAVFFLVLMVGFAFVWSRGDLDWVRALPRRFGDKERVSGVSVAGGVGEESVRAPTA